ncbi:hypothetical protein NKH48_13685 [Mesorhizobium sp. M1233]|uniref:GTP pyrophosphokinase n=1 Tax=Mesorhizobium sp. M1233 TaxID=2957072 RepID=UPI003334D74E
MTDTVGLTQEFELQRPLYESLTKNVARLLETLLDSSRIEYLQIESRTKEVDSLKDKIFRPDKEGKYKKLEDITDLSGIRVVTYYPEDVEKICHVVEECFLVDRVNTVDKTKPVSPDRFGYLSRHFIVSHSNSRSLLPENKIFDKMKAEIQVRTVLQHAWAVLDRRLRYNSDLAIPDEIKRKLYRVSAKLEDADENFTDIEAKVKALRESYSRQISEKGNIVAKVNRDSVDVFLEESPQSGKIADSAFKVGLVLAEITRPDEAAKSYSRLASTLQGCDIRTIGRLSEILEAMEEKYDSIFRSLAVAPETEKYITRYGVIRVLLTFSDDISISSAAKKYGGYSPDGLLRLKRIAESLQK